MSMNYSCGWFWGLRNTLRFMLSRFHLTENRKKSCTTADKKLYTRNVISTRCFHGHRLSGALIEMHLIDVQLARMKWCWWCLMKRLIEALNALSSRRHVKESVHDIVRWTREIVINYANDDLNDTRHTFLRAAKSLKRRSSRETFRSSIKRSIKRHA